jgi:hypothetical protein
LQGAAGRTADVIVCYRGHVGELLRHRAVLRLEPRCLDLLFSLALLVRVRVRVRARVRVRVRIRVRVRVRARVRVRFFSCAPRPSPYAS